ncbi:MAG: hypothetical protein Q7S44_03870 [bacterium]|nr:hypothetical protein [bacterium]
MPHDLLNQQDELQKEAQGVLEDLDLMNLLKEFGEPHIVGSLALGVMTWRDIDLEIVVGKLDKEVVAEVIKQLVVKTIYKIDVTFSDNIARFNNSNPNSPQSLYIGLKYFGKDITPIEMRGSNPLTWKLDLHFILEKDARGKAKTEELKNKITDDKRRIILEIKSQIASNPKYRKQIFSMDIYQAVLERGITNLEEFGKFLAETGREL